MVPSPSGSLPRKPASLSCPGDDMFGFETLLKKLSHLLHVGCGVLEEVLISLTQGVEPLLASACGGKAVLGTFATAGKEVLALAAIAGQAIALLYAKAKEFRLTL